MATSFVRIDSLKDEETWHEVKDKKIFARKNCYAFYQLHQKGDCIHNNGGDTVHHDNHHSSQIKPDYNFRNYPKMSRHRFSLFQKPLFERTDEQQQSDMVSQLSPTHVQESAHYLPKKNESVVSSCLSLLRLFSRTNLWIIYIKRWPCLNYYSKRLVIEVF